MALHEWQKEFKLKDELLQKDFEALEDALIKLPRSMLLRNTNSSLSSGAMLRAAIRAGWIEAPECRSLTDDTNKKAAFFYAGKDVDEMHPAAVDWLGKQVDNRYNTMKGKVPKNL